MSKNVPLEKLEKLDKINDKIIDIYNYRKIKINYSLFSVKTRNQTKRLINSVINDEVLSKKEKINYIRKLIRKERVVNSFKKRSENKETIKSKFIGWLIRRKFTHLIYYSSKINYQISSKRRKRVNYE